MTARIARLSDQHRPLIVAAAFLFALVLAYIALCLVVLHRPEWLPSHSIFYASLVGPPHWLVWGSGARSMFWSSTLAIVAVAAIGAIFRPLVLLSAGLCFLIWLSAGFLSVAMSV
jgi:hypothetical protein